MNEYLTESLLGDFLLKRISDDFINDKKLAGSDINGRYDWISYKLKLIVEFDGYGHYTRSKQILNDDKKDVVAKELNFKIIRIPYFIQLDEEVIKTFFRDYTTDYSVYNVYPHGFIDKKVMYPSDFCELGTNSFIDFLNTHKDKKFVSDIISNLRSAYSKTGHNKRIYINKTTDDFICKFIGK